jgi:hypothetical protein
MPPPEADEVTGLWCPSARPTDGVIFAVRVADPNASGINYLDRFVPVSEDLLELAEPIDPREVFRFAAPCAGAECTHFTGSRCSLVERIVNSVEAVVDTPAPCSIRSRCRWFAEEASEACRRCPGIITLQTHPSKAVERAALPERAMPMPVDLPMPVIKILSNSGESGTN